MKKNPKRGGRREGAGRKPDADTARDIYLHLRVTSEEKARWQKSAGSTPLSQWVRDSLDAASRK